MAMSMTLDVQVEVCAFVGIANKESNRRNILCNFIIPPPSEKIIESAVCGI